MQALCTACYGQGLDGPRASHRLVLLVMPWLSPWPLAWTHVCVQIAWFSSQLSKWCYFPIVPMQAMFPRHQVTRQVRE